MLEFALKSEFVKELLMAQNEEVIKINN